MAFNALAAPHEREERTMATYFLHLHECGTISEDTQGSEFESVAAVREHAVEAARDIMSADVREGRLCVSFHIQIADANRQPIMDLKFKDALEISGL
jgi:hypothetical protein